MKRKKKLKICVTGYLGYLGKEITFRLRMMGLDVIGIDTKVGTDVRKDILKCDVCIHCAASLENETKYNIDCTIPVIEKAKKIVFLSSAAVYGNILGATEETSLAFFQNEYGKGKVECERLIKKSKKPYTIFRLSNVYSRNADHGVIARFLQGYKIINGNGRKIRDFVRLEDIVPVIVEAAITNKWRGIYNLSSGKGISILALFKRMFPKEKPVFKKDIENEILYSVLDNTKAKKKGFRPQTL